MPCNAKNQQGATLVVTLIILLVVSWLGIASMRSSNLELKMAISSRDRAVAFEAAESALATIENNLAQTPIPYTSFSADCANGLCFSGDFEGAVDKAECMLSDVNNLGVEQPWRNITNWQDAAKYATINVLTNAGNGGAAIPAQVRYMVEFMCFVQNGLVIVKSTSDTVNKPNYVPLYRITVQASGDANRGAVMLQSVFKVGQS